MEKINSEWVCCPVCGNKTRDKIRKDTVLVHYPLYCPKCKRETLINAKKLHITVIKEPDAQTRIVFISPPSPPYKKTEF